MSARAKIRDIRVTAPSSKRNGKRLSREHRAAAQEAILLINHHKSIVMQIEATLFAMLKEAYGVDVSQGQWNINFATGEITQVEPPQAQPPGDSNG